MTQRDVVLSDAAIDWIVRLNSGRATPQDRDAFEVWRRQSAEHAIAAHEAEALWQGIGRAGKSLRDRPRRLASRRTVLGLGALALGGGVLAGSGIVGRHLFAEFATAAGQQATAMLRDGTRVQLNASTALSSAFDGHERRVSLLSGQATFTVAPDPARPFVVAAADGQVQASGAVFDVDLRPRDTVVTVIEGQVAVAAGPGLARKAEARANQTVRYGSGGVSTPKAVDAEIGTAWRRGKLIFDRRSLGDVLGEVERQQGGVIVVANARLRALEVTGVFDIAEPEAILATIEATLPVRVSRLPFVTIVR